MVTVSAAGGGGEYIHGDARRGRRAIGCRATDADGKVVGVDDQFHAARPKVLVEEHLLPGLMPDTDTTIRRFSVQSGREASQSVGDILDDVGVTGLNALSVRISSRALPPASSVARN